MNKSDLALAVALAALATEATAAGFIEDSKASIGLRNFYYDLNTKNTANNNGEAQEWGQGFIFNYSSGYRRHRRLCAVPSL
ncbi:hypothetical protein BHX98_20510 [Acinetobacter baumannii]|uniref:OprD family outer membrane porin n=1 Tax=Acinetobacter baumannii TaxID=470 RepID=UPI00095CD122|nr:OprD family outer membrane porin [Acinetobacter baumannii]OLQ71781.1 hypothetical protein BHX98_20510 [Acinetobacter baumannii]